MSPKVYLISRPHFDVDALISFLRDEGTVWKRSSDAADRQQIVEVAGRICYMSFGENQSARTNAEYIRRLILMGHESVLEHVNWTFLVTGVSRAFTHQLVRHRVGFAFSQLSQQYHDETDAEFIEPSQLRKFPGASAAWLRAIQAAKEAYRDILASLKELDKQAGAELQKREIRRAIRSAARSVLPNATESKILVTANARALRHFIRIRGSIPGDEEMRQVAAELLKHLHKEAPSLFWAHDGMLSHQTHGWKTPREEQP